jgi:hypothetical protein
VSDAGMAKSRQLVFWLRWPRPRAWLFLLAGIEDDAVADLTEMKAGLK